MNCQIQIPKHIQLRDKTFSNNIMLNVLAALENLAFFHGYKKGNKIFDYYSGDARNDKTSLTNAVILQLEIFRNSHLNYVSNYSTYNFPKNLTKDQIILYISELKQSVPPESQIYYLEIINYLRGNSNISGIENKIKEKMREWGPIKKEDLLRVSRASAYTNTYMFDQINEVKNSYQKTNDYQINARLGEVKGNNHLQKKLHLSEEELQKQISKMAKIENDIKESFDNIQKSLDNKEKLKKEFGNLKKNILALENIYNLIEIEDKDIQQKYEYYKNIVQTIQSLGNPELTNIINGFCKKIMDIYSSNGKIKYN
jgi:hypothetical protein